MVEIIIDSKNIHIEKGSSIIQACEKSGIEIPRFCYHEKLKVAGNCRMCLVEVNGRLVASCAMEVSEGMVVDTKTENVKKAREGVMEFLLINHPLDCPICDQGGECDLQDQAMKYGKCSSRFEEDKRSVKDKYFGPLIKTQMTRCIHCTRCVRFATDIAGVEEIGTFGRGENLEISTYLTKTITSELSGNLIDVCPVGALTSAPYAFKARSWELKKTETIDVSDAIGSNIRVDSRGMQVQRILPRLNEDINEEWISDKTRFFYDGLSNQRLDRPYIRSGNYLKEATWEDALDLIKVRAKGLNGDQMAAIAGDMADCESIMVLKDIMDYLGSPNIDSVPNGVYLDSRSRSSYLFNTSIAGIENSDLCLLIGADPRHEATMINARIRKRWLRGGYKIFSIGQKLDLTYPVELLGSDPKILESILKGEDKCVPALKSAKRPMMIIGYGALSREDADHILYLCSKIAEKYGFIESEWNGFNILHRSASIVGALDLKFVPGPEGMRTGEIINATISNDIKFLYLLGADDIDVRNLKNSSFIVYQGHHGDKSANIADVVLPGAAFTEKDATYVNIEGRIQRGRLCVDRVGQAKEDCAILLEVAAKLGVKLKYQTKEELRKAMCLVSKNFSNLDNISKNKWVGCGKKGRLNSDKISSLPNNYYTSNVICRASKTMADCVDKIQRVTIVDYDLSL